MNGQRLNSMLPRRFIMYNGKEFAKCLIQDKKK